VGEGPTPTPRRDARGDAVTWSARVVVVSDSVAAGHATDRGGQAVVASLEAAGFVVDAVQVIPDGREGVGEALVEMCDGFVGLVVTTGGTGFGPRDLTPEGTEIVLDRRAPGLAEAMRAVNPLGRLTRGVAGVRGRALIVNLPGSPSGARESLEAILDVVPHALDLLSGGPARHGHVPPR
jgi:molybdenum cofactor synthesis domain-containing protein